MTYNDLCKGRDSCKDRIYFITATTHDRIPCFSDLFIARKIVLEMRRLHDLNLVQSLAWVLMPDHLHWLFQLSGKDDLPSVMKKFKGRTARLLNLQLNRNGQIWQKGFYDHALRKDEDIREIASYIVANPIRAGLVETVGEYPLWDAIWW